MTLTKFRIIVRRRWPLVALAAMLCLGAAFLVAVATDDEPAALPESAGSDSYLAIGVVSVDRSQLFDRSLDLGVAILEVEEAGLYEQVDEELGLPGGVDALRESTQIFPGTTPGLGSSSGDTDAEGTAGNQDPNAVVPTNEAVLIQASNLDGETATLQADTVASTWATLANLVDQEKLATFTETLGEEIAAVEEQLLTFDETNPRIAQLEQAVEPGDAFLIGQRQVLQTRLDALVQQLTQPSANVRTAPFVKLPTQDAQLISELPELQESTTDKLTSFAVEWVLPLLFGLLLAVGLVYLLEKMFPRVDTRDDIQDALGIPVLAEVPRMRRPRVRPHSLDDLHGPDAEMYRSLRSSLEFIATTDREMAGLTTNGNGDHKQRSDVVMIVSPTPAEGKTRSAAFLGLSYAEAGHDVALFGCDFRRPDLHEYFGVERDPGLGSLVANGSVELYDVVKRTDIDGLLVVPSGEPTNKTVPIVDSVSELIDAARSSGVDVIIDTAPLLVANDAADLVEFADHVVLIVRAGKTHLNAAKEAVEVLKRHDAPIAGAVVVASHPADGGYYQYYRQYGYYRPTKEGRRSLVPWRRRKASSEPG